MPDVRVEVATERDPDELATIVTDFYGVHTWNAQVHDTAPDGTRPNTRLSTMATGAQVVEELVDSGPTFVRYRMITDAGSPISGYESELRVGPGAESGALLSWSARFSCDPAHEQALGDGVRAMFQQGLADLAAT